MLRAHLNAILNKWVFRSILNLLSESVNLMSVGRAFHISGAAALKALLPILVLVRLVFNRFLSVERSILAGVYLDIKSCRYGGLFWCNARKVRVAILNRIRCSTGSQWSLSRIDREWALHLDLFTTLAEVFCTRCNLDRLSTDVP